MENCIFCGILREEISSFTIFKDETATVILEKKKVKL